MQATLLVELLTEELPPRSLRALSEAFKDRLFSSLVKAQLKVPDFKDTHTYATPRRLAVSIADVADKGLDRESEITGPSVKAPAEAIAGFARKHGLAVNELGKQAGPKGEAVVARIKVKGLELDKVLAPYVEDALKGLPIPKVMRWGSGDAQFVRPVHGLVMLHGERVVPGTVLGLSAGNATRGHRFMSAGVIKLKQATEYAETLLREGRVIADFAARRADIDAQLRAEAERQQAVLGDYEDLLDEVTALVEHPTVYMGKFDPAFLEVPQECLILTMRQNQKYFPLFDAGGRLKPRFLIVSNMQVADPQHIIGGNERVVRPRLEDARFFYQQDRKQRLESRVPQLGRVVYHSKLGTQLERVQRIQLAAGAIARKLGADAAAAERAAWLSKADLLTGMVGEFPELQGVMGRYYAQHDGEPAEVAEAIASHYQPRFAGDALPASMVACSLALADKFDALSGLFSAGQAPTGDKDPFGLRRAALGVVRILIERKLELELDAIVERADVQDFVLERSRGYLQDQGYSAVEVEAVLSLRPMRLDLLPRQLEAVRAFSALPEAESLAAANKRIGNILKQAASVPAEFDAELLLLPEEKTLAAAFRRLQPDVDSAFRARDYTTALRRLASLKDPVDAFFDKVMVMDKDPRVRANRIGFLGRLHGTMNRVADLSKLAK
jgi:glycyl-tRNA synthetase beta chain